MGVAVDVLLPLALAIIMFVLGMGLRPVDFANVAAQPKAFAVGAFAQMLLLPLVCFALVSVVSLPPELAFGMMILALCPGGPSSNMLTRLADGDVALSVSLTAVITLVSVLTIPLVTPVLALYFLGSETQSVVLGGIAVRLVSLTLIPAALGMLARHIWPETVVRLEPYAVRLGAVIVALVIIGVLIFNFGLFKDNVGTLGAICAALLAVMILGSMALARLFGLPLAQGKTIAIDTSMQNGALGITIGAMVAGTPGTVSAFSVPSGVYSVFMYLIVIPLVAWLARRR